MLVKISIPEYSKNEISNYLGINLADHDYSKYNILSFYCDVLSKLRNLLLLKSSLSFFFLISGPSNIISVSSSLFLFLIVYKYKRIIDTVLFCLKNLGKLKECVLHINIELVVEV